LQIKTFSTDSVPPRERPRVWQQIIADLAKVDFRTEPTGAAPLSATITNYVGRRLRFSAYSFSPHVTTYHRRGAGRDGSGHFILSYLKQGNAVVLQDGREACVSAGDIVLFDPSRPVRIKAAMRVHSFDLSAEQLKALLPQVDVLTSIALKHDGGAGSILRCVLDELIAASGSLDDEVSDRIADAVPHLVAAALAAMPEASRVAPGRMDAYHLARIRGFVRDHLRHADLSPEMIARGVGLSTRRVHELFGSESTSLMRWIWQERLRRCGDELAAPALRNRSVAEIAFSWGFTSQAHFSRAFRAHTGFTPRDFRRQRG
jgi:AraC family transcriptional activator of tynA and feaB